MVRLAYTCPAKEDLIAAGTHWEWRAFGSVPLGAVLRIVRLPKHFGPDDRGAVQTDEYLVEPRSDVNAKLRDGVLKCKRRLDSAADGCELWTEETEDAFDFPLGDDAFRYLRERMGVRLPADLDALRGSPDALRRAVGEFEPPLALVAVRKHRVQYDLDEDGIPLLVEIAEILAPVRTWSVCLEGGNLRTADGAIDAARSASSRRAIDAARAKLGLPGTLEVGGYLDQIRAWRGLGPR